MNKALFFLSPKLICIVFLGSKTNVISVIAKFAYQARTAEELSFLTGTVALYVFAVNESLVTTHNEIVDVGLCKKWSEFCLVMLVIFVIVMHLQVEILRFR